MIGYVLECEYLGITVVPLTSVFADFLSRENYRETEG